MSRPRHILDKAAKVTALDPATLIEEEFSVHGHFRHPLPEEGEKEALWGEFCDRVQTLIRACGLPDEIRSNKLWKLFLEELDPDLEEDVLEKLLRTRANILMLTPWHVDTERIQAGAIETITDHIIAKIDTEKGLASDVDRVPAINMDSLRTRIRIGIIGILHRNFESFDEMPLLRKDLLFPKNKEEPATPEEIRQAVRETIAEHADSTEKDGRMETFFRKLGLITIESPEEIKEALRDIKEARNLAIQYLKETIGLMDEASDFYLKTHSKAGKLKEISMFVHIQELQLFELLELLYTGKTNGRRTITSAKSPADYDVANQIEAILSLTTLFLQHKRNQSLRVVHDSYLKEIIDGVYGDVFEDTYTDFPLQVYEFEGDSAVEILRGRKTERARKLKGASGFVYCVGPRVKEAHSFVTKALRQGGTQIESLKDLTADRGVIDIPLRILVEENQPVPGLNMQFAKGILNSVANSLPYYGTDGTKEPLTYVDHLRDGEDLKPGQFLIEVKFDRNKKELPHIKMQACLRTQTGEIIGYEYQLFTTDVHGMTLHRSSPFHHDTGFKRQQRLIGGLDIIYQSSSPETRAAIRWEVDEIEREREDAIKVLWDTLVPLTPLAPSPSSPEAAPAAAQG